MMLNHKKICFIICVENETLYEKARFYIQRQAVPSEIQVECIPVRRKDSVAAAYNFAMKQSDAKYKVYLQQGVCIIHKNFITDILCIFKENKNIGVIGMAGAKYMPSDGELKATSVLLGAVYEDHKGKLSEQRYQGNHVLYTEAMVADGFLLATQYDVAWREDIFSGSSYYDLAQCLEFKRKNYKVVVVGQKIPWCIQNCDRKEKNDKEIEKGHFLAEYKVDLLPMVSILIPTYNRPAYFKIALESSLAQTYKNIEIIVCDNSTDERTAALMKHYTDQRITYLRNKHALTKAENFHPFEKAASGEYIQWLMDDDVLDPDKIERMVHCFLENPSVMLTTSNRRWIDENGNEIKVALQYDFGDQVDYAIVSGKLVGKRMLINSGNYIGEPSAVLFRRYDLQNHYWQADCRGYLRISDVAMWLELLQKGECACFQQALSSYRRHAGQEGQQLDVIIESRLEWIRLQQEYYKEKYFIENEEEYRKALQNLLYDAKEVIFPALANIEATELTDRYKTAIQEILEYIKM